MTKAEVGELAVAGDETKLEQIIDSGEWHLEKKYDGERCVIRVYTPELVVMMNRSGKSINAQFPELDRMARQLPKGLYDGEIYVPSNSHNKDKPTTSGRTSVKGSQADMLSRVKPAVFKCFDVLEYNGENIENLPYEERKMYLGEVDSLGIEGFDGVFPMGVGCQQTREESKKEIMDIWAEMKATGEEGMVAKRVGSKYTHCRSPDWMKLKTWKEADFKVVGFTTDKREISALVLDNGMKVNCALDGEAYGRLLSDIIKSGTMMKCNDGTLATCLSKHYTAKVKYLHQSASGLRFPILHELEGF